MSAANPTSASLWAGRVFTTLVFALAALAMADAVLGGPGRFAGPLFIAAGAVYSVGAVVLYLRGDYILRLFGCAWPFFLPRLDELQTTQRQRAFAATFAVFIGVFSFFVGLQIGAALLELARGQLVDAFLPSEPALVLLSLVFVLLVLTLAPQAYLAWTLTPLDDQEPA
jgi:hypothetical protein